MPDLGRRLRRAIALRRAPRVDHAALQWRGRRAGAWARVAGIGAVAVLAGALSPAAG